MVTKVKNLNKKPIETATTESGPVFRTSIAALMEATFTKFNSKTHTSHRVSTREEESSGRVVEGEIYGPNEFTPYDIRVRAAQKAKDANKNDSKNNETSFSSNFYGKDSGHLFKPDGGWVANEMRRRAASKGQPVFRGHGAAPAA